MKVGLEKTILEGNSTENSSLITTVKDILISSVKSLPFMDIDEDYNFSRFGVDLIKLSIFGWGIVEYCNAEPGSFDRTYAHRNLPLYLISAAPSFSRNLKKLNTKYHEFSKKIKEWKPKNFFCKAAKTTYEILEDDSMIIAMMTLFALDINIRQIRTPELYKELFDAIELKYGVGPTIPQHFALGYGITKGFHKFNSGVNENPNSVLPYILPLAVLGGWEAIELVNLEFFLVTPLDTAVDLVVGMLGYSVFWLENNQKSGNRSIVDTY